MKLRQYLEENLHKSTAKSYEYEIEKFRLLNRNTENYNYKKVMAYVQELRKTQTPKSVNRIVSALKKYYDYLIETEHRKNNPARSIKLKDNRTQAIQLQDLFTEKELKTLLEPRQERYPFLASRNQIIMSLLVNQAPTIGEIVKLKVEDIDFTKAQITITGTAKTNSRTLPLKAEQILLFYQYLKQDREKIKEKRQDNFYFLLNKLSNPITTDDINYLISTYQKQTTKKLTSITIRQSVITNLLNKGLDLRVVQYYVGHKHPDTTEKYKQTGINELQKSINKLHPIP